MKRQASYADLEALPETVVGELIGGELFVSRQPPPRSALAIGGGAGDLLNPFQRGKDGPGGWRILIKPEVHLGDDVLVPKVVAWRRERLPVIPDGPGITVAPDWVCEVLSPSTARTDLMLKLPLYAKQRVRHAWIVDPVNRSLQVYRLEGDAWVVASSFVGDDPVRAEPFEAIELDLSGWWD